MFVFAQPFSLGDIGGGARILRSVFDHAPIPVASICTAISRSTPSWNGNERAVPMRPQIGRIEHTRLAFLGGAVEKLYASTFRKAVRHELLKLNTTGLHLVPHSWGDFAEVACVARELMLPIHISIHDDFRHTAKGHLFKASLEVKLEELWNLAASRFVISQEMGLELCMRYGSQPFVLHTDGAARANSTVASPVSQSKRVYFMGMFLRAYQENFDCLLEGLNALNQIGKSETAFKFVARTVGLKLRTAAHQEFVRILPFADHSVVQMEAANSDFLYLPLPFGRKHEAFGRFSLSTKMVSYLASGVPIVYHGPPDTAAACYLRRNDAAILIESNSLNAVTSGLTKAINNTEWTRSIVQNALGAVQRDFDPVMLQRRFWDTVRTSTG
jgi:glycosyltransferase involved in cell wall biosynthesis